MIDNFASYALIDRHLYYGINVYQNYSFNTIYLGNTRINIDKITIEPTEENSIEIAPRQYYAHLPVNDEGEIFRSFFVDDVLAKIKTVIETRSASVQLLSLAGCVERSQRFFQDPDDAIIAVKEKLEEVEIDGDEQIEFQARISNDVGYCLFPTTIKKSVLLANTEETIKSIILNSFETYFQHEIINRINAEISPATKSELDELLNLTKEEWFPIKGELLKRLFSKIKFDQLHIRFEVDGIVSPVFEIQSNRETMMLRYYLARDGELKSFLEAL